MSSCAAEEILALFASGDLEEAEAARLRPHLAACGRCLDIVEDFRETRLWLKQCRQQPGALPVALVDDSGLAEMQRRLEARLERQRPLPRGIALLLRAWERLRHGPLGRAVTGGFAVLQPVLAVGVSAWLVLGAVQALSGDGGDGAAPPPTRLPALVTETATPPASGAAGDEQGRSGLRIEIQTPDPDVRIIWFAANEPSQRGGR